MIQFLWNWNCPVGDDWRSYWHGEGLEAGFQETGIGWIVDKGIENHIGNYHCVQGMVEEHYRELEQQDMVADRDGGDTLKGQNERLKMVKVVDRDGDWDGGDTLKGQNGRLKMVIVVDRDGDWNGGDTLKGQNGRLKMVIVVVVGMHKGKAVRNCMGRWYKQEDGVDLDMVEEGMHRDCGMDMKKMNHNYP